MELPYALSSAEGPPGAGRRSRRVSLLVLGLAGVVAPLAAFAQDGEVLIPIGVEWRYFKGTEAPPVEWNARDFDDGDWLAGETGIGYGDGDDATILDDMEDGYASVYCRRSFTVADAASLRRLILRIDYDDGFVAYLNGAEVVRRGLDGEPPPFDAFSSSHEAGTPETIDLSAGLEVIENGVNVLAVQVHNTSIGSSDLSFVPELAANELLCPTNAACSFAEGETTVTVSWVNTTEYDRIEVRRSGAILTDDLDGTTQEFVDLDPPSGELEYEIVAIDAGVPCDPLRCTVAVFTAQDVMVRPGDEWSYFKGTEPPPSAWNLPEFDDEEWLVGDTGIGYGDGDDETILDDMEDNYLTVFCRRVLDIEDPDALAALRFSSVCDDGLVVYLNGVEAGRYNIDENEDPDYDTAASSAIEPSVFELTLPVGELGPGENVLAVSVHNAGAGSSDLSFIPTVIRILRVEKPRFRRGDATNDTGVNLADAVAILGYLFRGEREPACLDAADTNDDGSVNLSDAIFLLTALFKGGPEPPAPGRECGEDGTADSLGVCRGRGC